jgi:voltage-gated potassium channel
MHNHTTAQLKFGLFLLASIIIIGTIGFEIIEEDMTFLDSFYMTIISITTTGFKEVHDLSAAGRVFTIFLIITGVLAIGYTGGKAAQIIIEKQVFRRRRMSKKLDVIGNHYIVCGYGRMGKQVCESLADNEVPFVVIENDEKEIELLIDKNYLFVNGDATADDTMRKAGIDRAKGLVACIQSDAENVFATLSAKELNPDVYVVARAVDEGTESKLRKAGANRVVKPYELGGNRMVQLLLRPGVIDFIDVIARDKTVDISLEEIVVKSNSILIGKTLIDSPIRRDLNIIIVAISRKDNKFIYNPQSTEVFEEGDKLIAIGEKQNLTRLNDFCFKGEQLG